MTKKEAVSQEELVSAMGLTEQTPYGEQLVKQIKNHPLKVCMCTMQKKTGFKEGFEWLEHQLP
jgi:hypothetical protein